MIRQKIENRRGRLLTALTWSMLVHVVILLVLAFIYAFTRTSEVPKVVVVATLETKPPEIPKARLTRIDRSPKELSASSSASVDNKKVFAASTPIVSTSLSPISMAVIEQLSLEHPADEFLSDQIGEFGLSKGLVYHSQIGMVGELKTMFASGEGLCVLLDVSGSMEDESAEALRIIERQFPDAFVIDNNGCSFKEGSSLFEKMNSFTRRSDVIHFAFLCDLQDGYDEEGLKLLNQATRMHAWPAKFTAFSFEKTGESALRDAIASTGGRVIKIDRETMFTLK